MALLSDSEDEPYFPPPANTLEGREQQLIAAATQLVEKRLHAGTATAQEVVYFLKQGSVQTRLQNEKIKNENEVLKARVKEMEGRKSQEDLIGKALAAFKGYAGLEPIDEDPEDSYDNDDGYYNGY